MLLYLVLEGCRTIPSELISEVDGSTQKHNDHFVFAPSEVNLLLILLLLDDASDAAENVRRQVDE